MNLSEKTLRQLDEMGRNNVSPYKSVRRANNKIEITDEIYDEKRKMCKAGKKRDRKKIKLGGVAAIVSLILAAISGWLIWYTATMG